MRIVSEQGLGNPDSFPFQFRFYFQGVANRLAAVMVVGDDESCLGLFGDQFGSFADLEELEFVVEIIIPGIPPRPLAKPILGVSSVQAQIPGRAGYFLCRLERVGNLRLVEVAEADSIFTQKPISRSPVPRGVADLQDKGVISKLPTQSFQELKIGFAVMKRVGKLEEQSPKGLGFQKRGKAVFEIGFVGLGESLAPVGEVSIEFGGEFELGVEAGSFQPAPAHLGGGNPIEGVVELEGVEILGKVSQGVEFRPSWGRINDPVPILIRPPCRADTDHRKNPFTAEHAENAEMNESLKFQQDPSFL